MAVVVLAIFSLTVVGVEGSIFLQLAHGVVSPALFIIVTLLYERHHKEVLHCFAAHAAVQYMHAQIS